MVENHRMDTDIFIFILAKFSSNERGNCIINVDIMVSNFLICYNEKSWLTKFLS